MAVKGTRRGSHARISDGSGNRQYNRKGRRRQTMLTKYKACQENVTDRKGGRPSVHNTELKGLETLCTSSAFRLAAKEFNEEFSCVHHSETKLVRITSVRTNKGYRSCTFMCGCNKAPSTLQFRQYFGAVATIEGKENFIFTVFVQEETLEDSSAHFVSVSNQRKSKDSVETL
jgi:hypothetical protein